MRLTGSPQPRGHYNAKLEWGLQGLHQSANMSEVGPQRCDSGPRDCSWNYTLRVANRNQNDPPSVLQVGKEYVLRARLTNPLYVDGFGFQARREGRRKVSFAGWPRAALSLA